MFILFTIPSCIGFSHRKTKASPKYMLECCIKISLGKFTNMLILVTWEEGPWVASAKGGTFHSLLFNTFWILNYALGWPKSSFGCFQMTLQKNSNGLFGQPNISHNCSESWESWYRDSRPSLIPFEASLPHISSHLILSLAFTL